MTRVLAQKVISMEKAKGLVKEAKLQTDFLRRQSRGVRQDSQKPIKGKLDEMNRFGSFVRYEKSQDNLIESYGGSAY